MVLQRDRLIWHLRVLLEHKGFCTCWRVKILSRIIAVHERSLRDVCIQYKTLIYHNAIEQSRKYMFRVHNSKTLGCGSNGLATRAMSLFNLVLHPFKRKRKKNVAFTFALTFAFAWCGYTIRQSNIHGGGGAETVRFTGRDFNIKYLKILVVLKQSNIKFKCFS